MRITKEALVMIRRARRRKTVTARSFAKKIGTKGVIGIVASQVDRNLLPPNRSLLCRRRHHGGLGSFRKRIQRVRSAGSLRGAYRSIWRPQIRRGTNHREKELRGSLKAPNLKRQLQERILPEQRTPAVGYDTDSSA